MNTSKIILVAFAVLTSSLTALAQPGAKKEQLKAQREKIKAMKIAYITDKLELSPEESEKFWPVYNKYETQKKALHQANRKKHNLSEVLTEEKANELIKMDIATREKELAIHKAYLSELKSVIPSVKIIKLHKAERDFKRVLLKKMKAVKRGRDDMPPHDGPMHH